MCVYIYVYLYVHIYIHIYQNHFDFATQSIANTYIHKYIHTDIHINICVCIYIHIYTYTHIYIHICIYTYLYICTHTRRSKHIRGTGAIWKLKKQRARTCVKHTLTHTHCRQTHNTDTHTPSCRALCSPQSQEIPPFWTPSQRMLIVPRLPYLLLLLTPPKKLKSQFCRHFTYNVVESCLF